MKKLFIPTKKKFYDVDLTKLSEIKETKIALAYSIQFEELAISIEKELEGKVVQKVQVLGCSSPTFDDSVEAILLIGEGKFHSVSLAYETGKKVYLFNESGLIEVSSEEVEKLEKREKGAYLRYLHSESVGIMISTKPGQQRMKRAIEFKENVSEKKSYLFLANELKINEFENFGLDSWVNTACPRMDLDEASVINITKVEKSQ
jgi:diphthamide biosynthesis enzyme Dph1/Dph2-like protein